MTSNPDTCRRPPGSRCFNGSAVKNITEYEAAYNYVHDNQGNGLWCDVGKDDPARGPNGGGISAADTQNAVIRNNFFGATKIAGVRYGPNDAKPGAVKVRDSGRTRSTDLWKIDIYNNNINGEAIIGCELSDDIVDCYGSTSPTLSSVVPTDGGCARRQLGGNFLRGYGRLHDNRDHLYSDTRR